MLLSILMVTVRLVQKTRPRSSSVDGVHMAKISKQDVRG